MRKHNVDNVENVLSRKLLTERNTNKVNEKALYEETHLNWILQFALENVHELLCLRCFTEALCDSFSHDTVRASSKSYLEKQTTYNFLSLVEIET